MHFCGAPHHAVAYAPKHLEIQIPQPKEAPRKQKEKDLSCAEPDPIRDASLEGIAVAQRAATTNTRGAHGTHTRGWTAHSEWQTEGDGHMQPWHG